MTDQEAMAEAKRRLALDPRFAATVMASVNVIADDLFVIRGCQLDASDRSLARISAAVALVVQEQAPW